MQTLNLDAFVTTLACLCASSDFASKSSLAGINNNGTIGFGTCAAEDLSSLKLKFDSFQQTAAKQINEIALLRKEVKQLKRAVNSGKNYPTSCEGQENKVINMRLEEWADPLEVQCFDGFSGNWTMVAKRKARGISFNRTFAEFRDGFGTHNEEFFIGLQILHEITTSQLHEILVLFKFKDVTAYGNYDAFEIGNEEEKYEIKKWGLYAGTVGDAYGIPVGSKFSTYDDENDTCPPTERCDYSGEEWIYSVGRWFCCSLGLLNFYNDFKLGYQEEIIWYIRPFHHH